MRYLVALLALFLCSATVAQDTPKPAEPEFAGSFFFLQRDSTLKVLERQRVSISMKTRGLGYGGIRYFYKMEGAHSPLRVNSANLPPIIVKLENANTDPANVVVLYPVQSANGKRELPYMAAGFFFSKEKDTQPKQIPLKFARYGQASVQVTPQNPLMPGEYAILADSGTRGPHAIVSDDGVIQQQLLLFCFGVDAN